MKFGPEYYDEAYFTQPGIKGRYGKSDFALDNGFHKQIASILQQTFHIEPDAKMLEIGCALGNVTYWLNKAGIFTYGIDISEYAIQHSHIPDMVKVADITKEIPFPDEYFTNVFTRETLEHIEYEQIPAVLKELYRVMKPGAQGLICPANNFGHKEFKKQNDPTNTDISHVCIKPPYWWADMFEQHGFKIDYKRSMWVQALPIFEQWMWTGLIIEKP